MPILKTRLALAVWLAFLLFVMPWESAGAQHTIYVRVTSDSGQAIAGADVLITIAPSAETIVGRTDEDGNYSLLLQGARATGEYLLYTSAVGRQSARQRISMPAGDSIVRVSVALKAAVTTIATVNVRARRARPNASFGREAGVAVGDGLNRRVDGVVNALPPDLQGDFNGLATLVPGVVVTSGGISAFGLAPSANLTQVNGMAFSGTALPRDLATSTTFLTSPWDPSRGGFSGALVSATVLSGTNVRRQRGRLSLDEPRLQWGDPLSAKYGQTFSNVQLGMAGSGPIALDKYFYNYGIQVSARTSPVASLLDLDGDALAAAGIAVDSASRLSSVLASKGIPRTLNRLASRRSTESGQFLARWDRAIPTARAEDIPLPAWSVLVGADYSLSTSFTMSPLIFPATSGEMRRGGAFVQSQFSRYLGKQGDFINETASAISYRASRGTPYLVLPSGRVQIASALQGETVGVGVLTFGGNSFVARDEGSWSWDLSNETNLLINHRASLPAKVFLQLRYDGFRRTVEGNQLGTFTYSSLDALEKDSPSSYTRQLNGPKSDGGMWTGAAAVGGSWSTRKLVLAGGARIDASAFTASAASNPSLESLLGVRNDISPRFIGLSPRIGFNWYPTAQSGPAQYSSAISTTYRTGYQIRGGVGLFRSTLSPTLMAGAMEATGLPGGSQQLSCTGAATPGSDWETYLQDASRVPTTCVGGTGEFADAAPRVTLVDGAYAPTEAWRATLGWTRTVWGHYLAIDAVYSLNRHQPGVRDINFDGVTRFSLPEENGRPVFASVGNVVPSTGLVSAVTSRRVPNYGTVLARVSDLRGETRQLVAYAVPRIPFRFGTATVGYTYTDARTQYRGFDGSTGIDPRSIEWTRPAYTPRHQFVLQAGRVFAGGAVALTVAGRVMSGTRYTPAVAGDVNGDGTSGDRAYVFDPASARDSSLARGLEALMNHGSASARSCLRRQLNSIAGLNSCEGPWSATLNASVFMPKVPHTNGRAQATLSVTNPLAGLDQLLHGRNTRGWGGVPITDGVLFHVTGFDAERRSYLYAVNSRFGTAVPTSNGFRVPFRVTLDVRVDIGRSPEEQRLELNLRVKPPLVGTRASVEEIKTRYVSNAFGDMYRSLFRLGDSLALSRSQVEQMQVRDRTLRARLDTIYAALAIELAALPKAYNAREAVGRVTRADGLAWNAIYDEAPFLRRVLTPGQVRLLPRILQAMLITPNFRARFFF